HTPEPNFTSIAQTPASSNFTGTSETGPGRYEVFPARERTAIDDGQHSNRDLPPYSAGNRGGSAPGWGVNMDIDQRDEVHSSHSSSPSNIPYHYVNHSITPERNVSRSLVDVKREEEPPYSLIKSDAEGMSHTNIKREEASSALGSSSMKIRDLLN
ncbi:4706_t:CDS:1, partial [Acaulospora morrowiae]